MKRKIELASWYFLALWRHKTDWLYTVFHFYRRGGFWKSDLGLRSQYFFDNPYRVSKRFLKKSGANELYTYGETPLRALEKIVFECNLTPDDTLFDLGCGTGHTTFWFSQVWGCRAVGIDCIGTFIRRAKRVQHWIGGGETARLSFKTDDFLKINYQTATAVYLYGTSLDDAVIESLAERLSTLPQGAKVITVSYPLTDYQTSPWFTLVKTFPVAFTWGIADVYLAIRQ